MEFQFNISSKAKSQQIGQKFLVLSGGGALAVFGVFFYIPLAIMGTKYLSGDQEFDIGIIFALLFATVATCLVFGREGKELDRDRGTFTTWQGTRHWRIWKKERQLEELTQVRVQTETRSNKDSTYTVHAIYLDTSDDEGAWQEPGDYLEARRMCEALSRFLNIPFDDRVTGHRKEPDELDLSVYQRWQREGKEMPTRATPPTESKIVHVENGMDSRFEFPQAIEWLTLVIPCLLPLMLAAFLTDSPWIVDRLGLQKIQMICGGFFLLLLAHVVFKLYQLHKVPMVVTISRDGLTYGKKGKPKSNLVIPLNRIEELDLVGEKGKWEARSDDIVIAVNGKLSSEELSWLFEEARYQVLRLSAQLAI